MVNRVIEDWHYFTTNHHAVQIAVNLPFSGAPNSPYRRRHLPAKHGRLFDLIVLTHPTQRFPNRSFLELKWKLIDATKTIDQDSQRVHIMIRAQPFFTIGHSTRPIAVFVDLLRNAKIRLIIDVRTVPRSRTNPQYNGDALPESLSEFQIAYEHIAALGGLRGRRPGLPAAVNAFWKNQSFHNYADYAMSESFHSGFIRLRELGQAKRCAIMCAEVVWWRCHRRIIADYLIAAGENVFHILGRDHVEQAQITEGAKLGSNGMLTYPGDVGKLS